MVDSDCSNLICQEDATHLNEDDDNHHHPMITIARQNPKPDGSALTQADDEYIELLVSDETVDWLKRARSDSIAWILRMKSCFGLGEQTAYLAVSYLDRFLARRTINEGKAWALRLLSAACVSLAAKMEELQPPALPEFHSHDCHFDSNTIQRMELMVLSTLEWRMCSATPFAYLDYFAAKLGDEDSAQDVLSIATTFILAILQVMNAMDHRPSALAAAAVLAASGQALTKDLVESKISRIAWPESMEAEHVFACYSLMMIQGSERDASIDAIGCKRRRLL